jgi:ABC-type multidrug transport system permease subunit
MTIFHPTLIKETQLLVADRGALLRMFLLPLAFMTFFGLMFATGDDGDPPRRPIAVWADASDPRLARIVATLQASPRFTVRIEASADHVRKQVLDGAVAAGLILPADFAPFAGRPAELVIDEAAPPAVRGPLEGALTGIVASAYFGDDGGQGTAPELNLLVARSPPGMRKPLTGAGSFQISVPANAVLFSFFLAVAMGLAFVEERTTGTWRRLLAAPVHRSRMLLAKLVPYYLVGLVQMAFLFGIGVLVFHMQIGGSVVGLVLVTMASVYCAVSLGLLVASFGGTAKKVGGIGSLVVLLMALIGGCMVPRLLMPDSLKALGLLVPHGWALDAYYDLLIRDGTTVADVAWPLLALVGFGTAFATVGALRFRFER